MTAIVAWIAARAAAGGLSQQDAAAVVWTPPPPRCKDAPRHLGLATERYEQAARTLTATLLPPAPDRRIARMNWPGWRAGWVQMDGYQPR